MVGNHFECLAQGPDELHPNNEEAGCTLQVQVRAPLRTAPAGNARIYFAWYAEPLVSAGTVSPWNKLANNLS